MTPLLANPFLNPDALPPCASEAAAPSAPQSGAAATISDATCFDCGMHEPCDENCPNYSEPSMTMEEPRKRQAPDAMNPHNGAGALDELQELLAYAHKRHRAFVPDEEAILAAMWADPAPLFLRRAG